MDMWMKIAWTVVLVMMLAFMFPRAMHWFKHGPRAQEGDWMAAVLPLAAVVGFVILLIMMVR